MPNGPWHPAPAPDRPPRALRPVAPASPRIGGFAEVFAGFASGETAGTRAMFILSGLVSVAFGVLLFARPGVGAVTLALLFGLYSLIYGFSQITAGIQIRHLGGSVNSRSELWRAAAQPIAGTGGPA